MTFLGPKVEVLKVTPTIVLKISPILVAKQLISMMTRAHVVVITSCISFRRSGCVFSFKI